MLGEKRGSQAINRANWTVTHGFLFVLLMAAASFVPVFRFWPFLWCGTLASYGAIVLAIPPLRATFRPWRFGRVSAGSLIATCIIAIGSSSVLVAFHALARPDVSAYREFLSVATLDGVVMAGMLFSVLNALFEEIVFRGILFDAVESQWGEPIAVFVTAVLFGYFHKQGYPPGAIGAALAGVFGFCLGWPRIVTGGIGLSVVAHIAADATIFSILVRDSAL
jgi:hypothetical protein